MDASCGSEATALCVEAGEAGSRLDVFLATRLGVSRAEARRLLASGDVHLDGRPLGAGAKGLRLAGGARVELPDFTRPELRRARAEPDAPLTVLAEGDGWVALDKPAGVPVHPLSQTEEGTLLGALLARRPEVQGLGEGGLRSGVVHRLDVDTSGVVLFATGQARWTALRRAFQGREVEKRYRAIVLGRPAETGRADLRLRVASHRPARVRVVEQDGPNVRPARLGWRVLERFETASLVEVSLETGFLHQIRVSFAHLGFPVAGDRVYGEGAEDDTGAARQLLHAARVAWRDVCSESPDPPDFAAALERLRA